MEDIVIRNLCKSFAGKPVLRDFSAVLPVGQVTGLMAPSGAGKTTLLRILMGLERPDGGTIDGLAGLRLSAVFQEDRLCDNLDPSANISLINPTLGRRETEDALAAVVLAGVVGAVFAPLFAKWFRVTDPVAQGLATGACSHALGTTKAMEMGELQGAMSSIAICVCGIFTSSLALFI